MAVLVWALPHKMEEDLKRSSRSKRIALVLGLIVFVWYVVSMFTMWQQ